MADGVFNIAKGAAAEKIRNNSNSMGVMLLKANETESDLIDRDDLAAILNQGGNTEADFTNYSRKTGISATINVDDSNDRVDIDIPDQSWLSAGNGTNNTLTKAIVFVEQSATDSDRIPLTHHDLNTTTDGSDLKIKFASAGFFRAS